MANTYTTYKDSGIPWIGEIPKEWKVRAIKYMFRTSKGLNITKADLVEQGYPVISYGQIHSKNNTGTSVKEEMIRFVPGAFIKTNPDCLVSNGSFIFADTSEDIEGCGNAAYINTINPLFAGYHTVILNPINQASNKYFAYLFLTDCWRSQIRSQVSGIKVFSISQKIINTTSLIIPTPVEQESIANFLDEKCSEIDALISLQEKMIDELKAYKQSVITEAVTKGLDRNVKMKDSGVDWIGEIPEHWNLSRVGLQFDIILGKMICDKPLKDYTLEPYFCAANVHFDGICNLEGLKKMWFSNEEKQKYLVNSGDLLVVEGGAGAGGCSIVKQIEVPTYIQNSIMIVRSIHNNVRFLKYVIERFVLQGYIDFVCNKATIPHFTKDKLSQVPFAFPTIEEQSQIADYLDRKYNEIDSLISIKEKKIEKLKDYKKSLIYEYVTGKKRV